jgi:phosphoribosyl-AMP cyclohydrolase
MNREALARTVEIGQAVYWSRSRKKLWHKGEESGHFQKVHEIRLDCDEDVVLLKVEQVAGIACHTGRHSCFFQKFEGSADSGEWVTVEPVLKDLPPGAGGGPATAAAAEPAAKPKRVRKTIPKPVDSDKTPS